MANRKMNLVFKIIEYLSVTLEESSFGEPCMIPKV